ncbi:hypothetical protein HQ576_07595, partial [bacterium]|nr:hypothetical protein [bacterium]
KLLRCPKQRVSRHIEYLKARGVVEGKRRGRDLFYQLAAPRHELHRCVLAALRASLAAVEEVHRDSARLVKGARGNDRRGK